MCERTILPGERISEYVAPDGERVNVCALCKPRAEASGWIPAEQAGRLAREPAPRRRRSFNLRQRLTRASEAASVLLPQREEGEGEAPAPDSKREASVREDPGPESPDSHARRPAQGRAPRPVAAEPERALPAKGETAEPLTRERLMRLAVEGFNAGPGPRKVAGLIRSLGEPRVAVRANGAAKAVVTVAWEISWYQWEVAVDGGAREVREVRKGSEVSELEASERGWNATAADDGTIRLELANAGAAPSSS